MHFFHIPSDYFHVTAVFSCRPNQMYFVCIGQPVLAYTLYEYLNHGLSIAETCKALFIHRNTLYYRLEQIWTRLGCQPNDPVVLSQLPVSFAILRYLGKWEMIRNSKYTENGAV